MAKCGRVVEPHEWTWAGQIASRTLGLYLVVPLVESGSVLPVSWSNHPRLSGNFAIP